LSNHTPENLRLLCILAHPDDETLGTGGILAKYSAEGVATYLITATRGEVGWTAATDKYPGEEALGEIREQELRSAAKRLGISEVLFLDYMDGELDRVDPGEIIHKIAAHIQHIRPQVVVTFDPFGAYGHPDHIAISQFAASATILATCKALNDQLPHQVSKFYYFLDTIEDIHFYESIFGELRMNIDGIERTAAGWPLWSATTLIPVGSYAELIWEAMLCHKSQLPGLQALRNLAVDQRRRLWEVQKLYRVYSLVNGGRAVETDLFAGLR
jgi:LmbE family N-acetylglucosaminyl deacetylase